MTRKRAFSNLMDIIKEAHLCLLLSFEDDVCAISVTAQTAGCNHFHKK